MNCRQCELLQTGEPIKVIDWKANSPFGDDLYHFEDGYKCLYNGIESLKLSDLQKGTCRCK